jgi:mono/diheme cytochrome c family protein
MMDFPPIARLLGPNLTKGQGSRVAGFGPAHWDRIVRHGIRMDGTPATMPSEDFRNMTDQELSDIVAYIQAQPPVDNTVPPVTLGPIGKYLVASGKFVLSADLMESHDQPHSALPPKPAPTVEFGRHLASVCTGCHRQDLAGGPIAAGDPSWAPARNLTPHATGLAGWTYSQFVTAMREGKRPDGAALLSPMSLMMPYAQKMTDVELEALWAFLQSVPAVPSRN